MDAAQGFRKNSMSWCIEKKSVNKQAVKLGLTQFFKLLIQYLKEISAMQTHTQGASRTFFEFT